MFNRDAIKQRFVNSVKKINIEGWGEAYIRQWSGSERVAYMTASAKLTKQQKENQDINFEDVADNQFMLVAFGLCDEEGKRLYSDEEIIDLAKEINGEVIEKLYIEISNYNGLEVEEVKAEIKNSETTQKSDS